MKKKLVFVCMIICIITVGIYAAGKQEAENTKALKIGYSPLTTQIEYFQRVILGMKNKAADLGFELLIDDPQLDLNKQVTGLENLLTAGAQSLIICSLDPVAVEAAIDEAHAQGKSVVSHVSSFKGADVYVGLEEYKFGLAGGETFAKELKKIFNGNPVVANLNSDTLGEGLVQRNKGEIDGIKKYFPNMEIVANSTAFDEPKAMETIETMLQANPDINVVICTNDPAAYGTIDAVEAAGLELNKDIFICCLGDQFKTLDLLESGKILSSVSVSPEECGELMVQVAADLINNKTVDKDMPTPFTPLTKDNVNEWRKYKLSFGPME